jgi:hypothetical protein
MRDKKDIVTLLSISLIGSSLVKPTVSNPNSFAIKPTVGSVTEFISPSFASKLEWSKVLQKHSTASVIDVNMYKLSSPIPRNRPKVEVTVETSDKRSQSTPDEAQTAVAASARGDVQGRTVEQSSDKPRGMFSIEELRDLQSAISPRQIRESHVTPIGGARATSPQQHTRVSPEHTRERDWNSNFTASSKYSSKKYDSSIPKRSREVKSSSPIGDRHSNEHGAVPPASNQRVDNENMKMAVLDAMYEIFKFDSPTATATPSREAAEIENEYNEIEQYNYLRNAGKSNRVDAVKESDHYYPEVTQNREKSVPVNRINRYPAPQSLGRRSKSAPPAGAKRKDSTIGTPNSSSRRSSGTFGGSGGRRYDWVVQHIDKDARKHIGGSGSQEKKGQLNRIIQKVKSPSALRDATTQPYHMQEQQGHNSPVESSSNHYRNDVDSILTDFSNGSVENKQDSNDYRPRALHNSTLESGLRQFILRDVSEAAELTRLQNWLKAIDMGHYIDNFLRGGVTKMSIIELLRGDDLNSIGIDLTDIPYILSNIRKFSDATWSFTVQELLKKGGGSDRNMGVSSGETVVPTARVEEVAVLNENTIHEKSKELCWLLECGNYELFFRVWTDVIIPSITFVTENNASNEVEVRQRYLMRRTIEFYLHLYFIVYTVKNILSDSLMQSHFSFYKRAMDEFLQEKPSLSLLYTKEFTIAIAITMVPTPANNSAYSYFFSAPWSSAIKNMLSHYLFDCNDISSMSMYLVQVQVDNTAALSNKQESVPVTKSDNIPEAGKSSTSAQYATPSHTGLSRSSPEIRSDDRDVYDKSGENTPPRQVSMQQSRLANIFNSHTIQEVISSGDSTPTRVPTFTSNRTTKNLLNGSVDKIKSQNRESYSSAFDDDEQFSIQPELLNAIKELSSTESRRSLHIVANDAEKGDEGSGHDAFFGI